MKDLCRFIAFGAAALVAGCASVEQPMPDDPLPVREPAGECDAAPAQGLLGNKATTETGARLLTLTGASTLRWVPPRTAVTMDYRADRLTVSYDDDMTITRITCG